MNKIFFLIFVFSSFIANSQNLVINGSFEEYEYLPTKQSQISALSNWDDIYGTVDTYYEGFNLKENISYIINLSVPHNEYGYQDAFDGKSYIGGYKDNLSFENFAGMLSEELIKGNYYHIEYYVSLADNKRFATDNFGVYFSKEKFVFKTRYKMYEQVLNLEPQIQNPKGRVIDSKKEWTKISGTFKAEGGEKYIIIGSFGSIVNSTWKKTKRKKNCKKYPKKNTSYYYYDNVLLYEVDSLGNKIIPDTTLVLKSDSLQISKNDTISN